jgi:hypothetical protein
MSPFEDDNSAASDLGSGAATTALFAGASGDCCRRVSVAISCVSSLISFGAAHFDTAEHLADRLHHAQQRRGPLRIERELPIPQPS